jgi:hypothetical protein
VLQETRVAQASPVTADEEAVAQALRLTEPKVRIDTFAASNALRRMFSD